LAAVVVSCFVGCAYLGGLTVSRCCAHLRPQYRAIVPAAAQQQSVCTRIRPLAALLLPGLVLSSHLRAASPLTGHLTAYYASSHTCRCSVVQSGSNPPHLVVCERGSTARTRVYHTLRCISSSHCNMLPSEQLLRPPSLVLGLQQMVFRVVFAWLRLCTQLRWRCLCLLGCAVASGVLTSKTRPMRLPVWVCDCSVCCAPAALP
jgi:hypothetical protein